MKLASKLLLAAIFALPVAAAQAADVIDWHPYVGADYQYLSASYKSYNYDGYNVSPSTILPSSLSTGFALRVGEQFGPNYAAEVSYIQSQQTKSGNLYGVNYNGKITVYGPTADVLGFLPLWNGPISLVGTTGVSYLRASVHGDTDVDIGGSAAKSEFGWRIGGGLEWKPAEHYGIRLITRYQTADFDGLANGAVTANIGLNYYF